ncbi:hypothetical protein [Bacillus fonticola]|uniref:hypothetical protein n=1 Tax=Bacillus fonticola TaxID=2728853 RepID=UPI001475A9A6|nr:hypothetical protein [Bacillus fonticola]
MHLLLAAIAMIFPILLIEAYLQELEVAFVALSVCFFLLQVYVAKEIAQLKSRVKSLEKSGRKKK